MFYTAQARDETDVSSCKMEDCHRLVEVVGGETRLEVEMLLTDLELQ